MSKKILILIVCFALVGGAALADEKKKGKLDSFEEKIDEPEERHGTSTGQSIATQGAMDVMANFFLMGIQGSGYTNWSDMQKELRAMESPALPVIRVEGSYQYVFDGVHGFAGEIQMGYLMLGFEGEFLYYWERENDDNLKVVRGDALLRTLFAHIIEADMAMGVRSYIGDNAHTGFDLGFPCYIFFGKHFIWDIKPYITFMQGRDVYDLSSGLSYKYKMFGVRAAYRMVSVPGETLHGPRIGVFFQW